MVDVKRLGAAWLGSGEVIGWLAVSTIPKSLLSSALLQYFFLACALCYRYFIFVVFVLFLSCIGFGLFSCFRWSFTL